MNLPSGFSLSLSVRSELKIWPDVLSIGKERRQRRNNKVGIGIILIRILYGFIIGLTDGHQCGESHSLTHFSLL